jgi:hypothetical protein
LATDGGVDLIPSKTSPGAAKTFNSRPGSEVAGVGGAAGGGSGVGSMGSMFFFMRSYPLLRQKPAKVTRKVGVFLMEQYCETDFADSMGRAESP